MIQKIDLGDSEGDKKGTPARVAGAMINDNFEYLDNKIDVQNGVVVDAGYAISGTTVTMNANWKVNIAAAVYTNPVAVGVAVPLSAAGKTRIDLIVMNTSNSFTRVPGLEVTGSPVTAILPVKTVLVVKLIVTDTVVLNYNSSVKFLGSITPTSVPTGSGAAYWHATQSGTYTNFGGVVVAANSFAVISRNEAGGFSISQTALDLTNYASKAYVDGLVVGLIDDRGPYNASVNTFPTTGGSGTSGSIKKGDLWFVSVAGTLSGVPVRPGACFRALVDAPAQVAANWSILDASLGYVPENSGNKTSDIAADPISTDKFPNNKAVAEYVAANGGKIKPFVDGPYPINSQVNSLGKDWTNTAATVAGEIPGTSSKWVGRLNYIDAVKSRYDSVQPFFMDGSSTIPVVMTLSAIGSDLVFNWTGILFIASNFGTAVKYHHLVASSGTRTITLVNRQVAYVKKSDMASQANGSVLNVYLVDWGDSVLASTDVVILASHNQSLVLSEVSGMLADFSRKKLLQSTYDKTVTLQTAVDANLKRSIGITIIDNSATPSNYGFVVDENYLGNTNNIRISWTGTILIASLFDSDKYANLVASTGTRTVTLTNIDTTLYIKHSEILANHTGVLPVYLTRWSTALVKDPNNIILITKNKSGNFKDCTGIFSEFIKSQLNAAKFSDFSTRVSALEGSSNSPLSAYDRGQAKKEYTAVKKFGIITAGQSNTQGRVPLSTQPPSWYNPASPTIVPAKMWNNITKVWESFIVPSQWAYDTEVYYRLTNYLATEIYIVKHSQGGTAISEKANTVQPCWQPFFERPLAGQTKLTKQFEQYIREMMLSAEYSNIQIKAFLWHQGESDSVAASANAQSSADYYNNFKNLISYVRGIVGNPILPIVFGTISRTSAQYDAVVEAAQLKIAAEDANAYVVDMQNGTLLDLYHFDGVSSESLGNQMYNIIKTF